MTASELYLNFLPMVSNGSVELLDEKRLRAQLTGLERRARSGGKDLITHYQGGHDDLANAAAGACVMAAGSGANEAACFFSDYSVYPGSGNGLEDWPGESRGVPRPMNWG
jgi:hypothetical protein